MTFEKSEAEKRAEIEAYNALTQEECKGIRYNWDFVYMPEAFHKNKKRFLKWMLADAKTFLWSWYVEGYKNGPQDLQTYIYEYTNLKKYFNIRIIPNKKKKILYINLPDEHKGSELYCTAFVLSYEKGLLGNKNIEFFTIEEDSEKRYWIGTVTEDGEHIQYGEIPADVDERMESISYFVESDKAWREVLSQGDEMIC